MFNNNEKNFMKKLEMARRSVIGELEIDYVDGGWFAMDYREEFGCAFPIETELFNKPLITKSEATKKNIDVHKCFDECQVYYVG